MRRWVYVSAGLFLAGILLGLTRPAALTGILTQNLAELRELAGMLGPFQLSTALFIFFRNASALLLSFVFSPVLLLFPVMVLVLNGALLSFVVSLALELRPASFVVGALLPHGIIEIPAIILGEAAALSFGVSALMAVFSEDRRRLFKPALFKNLKVLLIAGVLLVPAAFIETFITPLLAGS